jgi:protein-export membrane protein SecD
MWKTRTLAVIILIIGAGVAFFVYKSEPGLNKNYATASSFFKNHPFRLGLDLSGGSHLIYNADVSQIPAGQVSDSMNALRDVIERRVNLFGVSEPVVQVQSGGLISGGGEQLIVDLPGITDVSKATTMIGQTPLLEFKLKSTATTPQKVTVGKDGKVDLGAINLDAQFTSTGLTGRYLKNATLVFDANNQPTIGLQFDSTGTQLFAQITKNNIGQTLAIFLDGSPLEEPTIKEEIPDGQAVISGSFTPTEARTLVGELNSGALPVPISLVSTQTIGASLGDKAVQSGVKAGVLGFLLISLFLVLWYRLPGLVAVLALLFYTALLLAIFKLLPVTLSAAGIGGFIISLGMAVDANVLIFERMKEEIRNGHSINDGIHAGFKRAWTSVRDSNTSSIITSIILFWLGSSLIQGFALTFGLGVLVSMFTAITVSRIFLFSLGINKSNRVTEFLFGSGFSSAKTVKVKP